ncbi:MAG: ceramide glucosyltransferase, partial [Mesorhizobium sp.]
MELTLAAAFASSALLLSNFASIMLASSRLKARRIIPPPAEKQPPVSEETLDRAFSLDWPRYELIFCVAGAEDPVVKLINAAIARFPKVPARLLVGDDRISANPKLNNCVKGWQAARHDWEILADSNVLMPKD